MDITVKHTPVLGLVSHYQLLEKVGTGEMGEVYRAKNTLTQRIVAVKVLNNKYAGNEVHLARFQRESKITQEILNPYLVHGLDSGFDDRTSQHYLVLEYVEGATLQAILEKQPILSVGNSFRIILDVAMGLSSAHQKGVVHRDVKPGNILINSQGRAVLTDLGLSKEMESQEDLTRTKHGFGTPYYMAFEQAVSAKAATLRSDVFSLGVTLYQMLTGKVPFPGETPLEVTEKKREADYILASEHNRQLPTFIDKLLEKMLAKEPEKRFSTAVEVVFALESLDLAYDKYKQEAVEVADLAVPLSEQSTNVDVKQGPRKAKRPWYIRYRNQKNDYVLRLAKTQQITSAVSKGILLETSEVSRDKEGPFFPIKEFMEFRDSFTEEEATPMILNYRKLVFFLLLAMVPVGLAFFFYWYLS